MKLLITLIVFICISTTLLSQKGKNKPPALPEFGKVEKADLELKECEFDEKAEALVLLDEGELDFILNSGFALHRRMRIKILSDKGLDWANVHLQFRSERNLQDITNLEAQTYNLDESGNIIITKLEKKLVYEKKINKKYTEKVFTFPAVKVGSIIEYKFKHSGIGLSDWYFQRSIPVKYSSFTTDFPEQIEAHTTPHCNREYQTSSDTKGTRIIRTYTMANVPGFRDEPFIINEDAYRDRLETKVIAIKDGDGRRISRTVNWVQVIRFLMEDEDFGVQVKRNIPRTADLDAQLKTLTNEYQRMKTIYKYVQSNMEWNDYLGIWALDGVRAAWKDKKGTAGEINLILVNLLKEADLDAHPVLVSTHDNGLVNASDPGTYESPGFYQFNKVMAYVKINNRVFVLDATDKTSPVHLIPHDVLMTEGLVIEKIETYEWGWKVLWDENQIARQTISVHGIIDSTGTMTGEANIISSDYARHSRAALAKKGKGKFIEKYITPGNPSMSVDDLQFENMDSDSLPLIQKIKFKQPMNSAGEYKYFSSNILSGLEQNPFIADTRSSDVFFGHIQKYQIVGNFMLPDGYELEGLPKNLKMIMPDTSIVMSRMSQVSGNMIMTKIQLDFKKPFYPVSQYEEFHEFYKQLFELINEQFVVRRKK
jgi:hypothetical protein